MSISALPLFNSNAKTWKAPHSRTSIRTLVVLFTITLVLGLLFILDYPLYPFTFQVDLEASPINIPKYTAIHEPSEGVSYVDFVNETSGVQATYHSFSPEPAELAIGDHNVRPIRVHQELSDTCLERWVAHGRWDGPCNSIDESVIDVIWVWVNGSDPLDALSRSQYVSSTGYHSKNARFREHDELRYSFRAAAEATQSWKQSVWHVVTADVPHPEDESRRLGLVPQWLDINASSLSRVEDSEGRTPVHLIHHSQLFRLLNSTNAELTAEDAFAWKDGVLPTFNSYSIESQLPNLDPRTVSENLVSLNDDQFLALPMSPSSFHTPLYGPVFRFDSALKVGGDASGKADGGGEWRSLGWTAHLMNARFGSRKRAYVHHNARSLSLPLMHEASLAFPAVFSATPLSRFRGSHSIPGKGEIEVNTMFLATHWVIERKREALLWSYIVAKWGGESGTLSSESKDAMWREMGGKVGRNSIRLDHIRKTTVDDVDDNLRLADLQSPRASDSNLASHTEYAFVSQDGYPASWSGMPLSAKLYRSSCLGKEPVSAWDLFLEVLQDKPDCGDAIIAAVIQQEGPGGGLAMFLPPGDMESTDELRLTLPLHPPADAPPLPTTSSNLRAFAVRLLHRYSFAIGDTPSRFFGLTSYKQGLRVLKDTSAQKDIALLCINDDMPENSGSDQFQKTDALLREWLEDRWSTSGDWELPPN